ncbi:MAG: RimK-like ATPgrasp N-terminal domain-containing protein [Methanoregula sp.]|nr:RimK-like ATPgrasp N-terminal domain-containing protein [Methanoregula sp.]
MNDRWGEPPCPEEVSFCQGTLSSVVVTAMTATPETILPSRFPVPFTPVAKPPAKTNGRKNHTLHKDSLVILKNGGDFHVISENYSYKSDAYYTILQMETEDKKTKPSTSAVIDAFVVPICLERAKLAGIPVCNWEISQAYVQLPAILYGLNYFATTAEFVAVYNNEKAKEAIKHITNKSKYPFCYQKLGEGAEISQCTVIFGKTIGQDDAVSQIAEKIYELFSIPLLMMVLVRTGENYALSSLSPVRYSHLSESERSLLEARITHQEFL